MKIEVRLFATLASYLPAGGAERGPTIVDVPEGSSVDDLARTLGIPAALPHIALVNGLDAAPGNALVPGDVVTLFPPLAGGSL